MSALAWVALGWTALAAGFTAVTLVRLPPRGRRPGPGTRVPVLLLRPVDAPTPRELENLSRPIRYAGPLEHVVLSPEAPRRGPGVRWLASEPSTPNRKVGHLLHALRELPTEGRVVLSVDADVAVTGALVEGLAEVVASGAALGTAVPVPVGARGLAGRAVAGLLRRTHHSFRSVFVMSAGARAVCGKALAFSPAALAELGELDEHIGEDLELSRRLHARGLEVALCEAPAVVPQGEGGTWRAALERFTRWMQVLASHRLELYPTVPLLFTPTWPLLLWGALQGARPLGAAVLGLVALRSVLSWRLAALDAPPPGSSFADERLWGHLFDWLLGEALLLAAFCASLARWGRVTWRGRTYALEAGGRMRPVWPEPSRGRG